MSPPTSAGVSAALNTDGVQYDSDEDPEAASYQIKHGIIPGRFVD